MGYNIKIFQCKVDPVFLCCQCNNVLENPVMCGFPRCHGLLCSTCLPADKETAALCPLCNNELPKPLRKPHGKFVRRLQCLLIKCTNECGATVLLGKLSAHLRSECPLAVIKCPHKLRGCKEEIIRRDIKTHFKTCDFERVSCEACGFTTLRHKLIYHQKARRCVESKLMREKVRSVNSATRGVKDHQKAIKKQAMKLEYQIMKTRSQRFEELSGRSVGRPYSAASTIDGFLNSNSTTSFMSNSVAKSRPGSSISTDTWSTFDDLNSQLSDCFTTTESLPGSDQNRVDRPSSQYSRCSSGRRSLASSMSISSTTLKVTCQRCGSLYLEKNNNQRACRWHRGPMADIMGGSCMQCGQMSFKPGCVVGFHKPEKNTFNLATQST